MRPFTLKIPRPPLPAEVEARLRLGDVDFEIGAGRGLFAVRFAQAHPERTLVSVERTHDKSASLLKRRAAHPELTNLFCAQGDAIAILAHYVPVGSVNHIHLLYPNPYPKPGQANRRWVNQPAMALLRAALMPGGGLTVATNLAWYADEAERQLVQTWKFGVVERREILPGEPARTHFEKKYLGRGETCFEIRSVKPESSV